MQRYRDVRLNSAAHGYHNIIRGGGRESGRLCLQLIRSGIESDEAVLTGFIGPCVAGQPGAGIRHADPGAGNDGLIRIENRPADTALVGVGLAPGQACQAQR